MSNKMKSCRDKELAGKVKQFPFLYDKSHSHFHRKDIKRRVKVSEELKGALSGLRQFLATESSLKMMKNAFYFTSKALFVLKIFKFFS